MKYYLRIIILVIIRPIIQMLHIFPIHRNRILFSAFGGKMYGCNAKYIFEYLYHSCGNKYEYIWVINDRNQIPADYKITPVKVHTLKYLYYVSTSRLVFNSHPIEPYFSKRKNQTIVNTSHGGGAYKVGGFNASFCTEAEIRYMKYMRNIRAVLTDYVISSCQRFSDIFSSEKELNIPIDKFLPIGMPRNDLFFAAESGNKFRRKICQTIGVNEHTTLILYAPTFRGNRRNISRLNSGINIHDICAAAAKRFNRDAVVLYRHHAIDNGKLPGAIDVSDYPDMQELLCAADILITDFSSSIWDFSMTHKPGFLYTPDLDEYEATTKFHTPIELWPYPYAYSNKELCANILNYRDEIAKSKIAEHHSLLGSFETGAASKQLCDLISNHL